MIFEEMDDLQKKFFKQADDLIQLRRRGLVSDLVSDEDFKEGIMSYEAVEVDKLPMCDICEYFSVATGLEAEEARYDSRLTRGMWAYTCQEHFELYGEGLGLGKGQKLTLRR